MSLSIKNPGKSSAWIRCYGVASRNIVNSSHIEISSKLDSLTAQTIAAVDCFCQPVKTFFSINFIFIINELTHTWGHNYIVGFRSTPVRLNSDGEVGLLGEEVTDDVRAVVAAYRHICHFDFCIDCELCRHLH